MCSEEYFEGHPQPYILPIGTDAMRENLVSLEDFEEKSNNENDAKSFKNSHSGLVTGEFKARAYRMFKDGDLTEDQARQIFGEEFQTIQHL